MAAVEVIAEEVAANLEEVASVTRSINASNVGYILGGVVIGAAVGFYFGRKLNKTKLRAEAFAEAETEVEEIRAHYQAKTVAAENTAKPDPADMVEELGYSVQDDMGNQELRSMPVPTQERPLPAPVPVTNVFIQTVGENTGETSVKKDKNDGWYLAQELESRSPNVPYVIHQDEYEDPVLDYTPVVYTFWAGDEVLSEGEDNTPIPNGEEIVGASNLKWGHGSDDVNVVFVRNDRLELDIQINRSPKSYEEEVLGLENDTGSN